MAAVSVEAFDTVRQVLAAGRSPDFHNQVRRAADSFSEVAAAVGSVSSRYPGVEVSPYINRGLRELQPREVREAA
jgi:hypothetical protein